MTDDTINRQAAINAIKTSRFLVDALEKILKLPSAQLENLQPTCNQLATNCISRQAAVDIVDFECGEWRGLAKTIIDRFEALPSAQSDIIRCKDCKHWMPYDWMFSEVWRSVDMDDYSDDEIGCVYCDMNMHANDFCSRAERRQT